MRTNKMALAAATATAVALSSLATPAMAAETGVVKVDGTATATGTATTGTATNGAASNGKTATGKDQGTSSSSLSDMDPKEIKEWLSVITAVLSIIGTVATFAMQYGPQFAPQR